MRSFQALIAALLVVAPVGARAETVRVAVAANFAATAKALASAFAAETEHQVALSVGSTGQLYAQVLRGAPFEVLLAADTERPRRLEAAGLAVPGSRFTYARGRLVLWCPEDGQPLARLRAGDFRRLAMANPKTAPYGAAAREALVRLGEWEAVRDRVITGQDVGQTLQFLLTGGAELGFVARSQLSLLPRAGAAWEVPSDLHQPLEQQAVLLRAGSGSRAFTAFLRGEAARGLIRSHGYEVE